MGKYKTAMGKNIDLDMLRSRNQNTRAVGNMNVDAAGNTLDSNNKVISDSTKRVNQIYGKTTVNPGATVRKDGHLSPLQRQLNSRSQEAQAIAASNELQPQVVQPQTVPEQPHQTSEHQQAPQPTPTRPGSRMAPQPDEPSLQPKSSPSDDILSSAELQNMVEWDDEEKPVKQPETTPEPTASAKPRRR